MTKKSKSYKGIDQRQTLAIKAEYQNTIVKFRHPKLGEISYDTSLLGEDQETYQIFYKNGWEFLFTPANSLETSKDSLETSKTSLETPKDSLENQPSSGKKSPENGPDSEQKLT